MKLGVCYYPEHWPRSEWAEHASSMVEMGIKVVRIGEFAWSRLEPADGELSFQWLQDSIDCLGNAGLEVVLGTPTATPPKWLVDKTPDILAVDQWGQQRRFGSRRHYCFSSPGYRQECKRIVTLLAKQFGRHPSVVAWQTDNEYGCHDTIFSYSEAARLAFSQWCSRQYADIDQLNQRWGNVFWSMEYNDFADIELPVSTVTEANPAHTLAFWRFSSDQVASFNKLQTDILRELSPGRALVHNYMGNFTDFDHYKVAKDLDVATWDNYPLGFLDRDGNCDEDLQRWYRTGHPDSSAMHHDLYRGAGRGRWWVMEQQPGPVNWAAHNPSPLPGMVRLWGWEAFAHGAEVVSYFRWQQAPFAQEQLHSGLRLPDGRNDTAAGEVATLSKEIARLGANTSGQRIDDQSIDDPAATGQPPVAAVLSETKVAIMFDYVGNAMQDIANFSGATSTAYAHFAEVYSACRRCGVNIDIVPADAPLQQYALVLLPNMVVVNEQVLASLRNCAGHIILFPGSGSRSADFATPENLAPGLLKQLIDVTVTRSETLPAFAKPSATTDEHQYHVRGWRERIDSPIEPSGYFDDSWDDDSWGFHYRQKNIHYLNATLQPQDLDAFVRHRMVEAGITVREAQQGLRYRESGQMVFAFNYGPDQAEVGKQDFLIGNSTLNPGELAIWHKP